MRNGTRTARLRPAAFFAGEPRIRAGRVVLLDINTVPIETFDRCLRGPLSKRN
jgi:hypothetical protein